MKEFTSESISEREFYLSLLQKAGYFDGKKEHCHTAKENFNTMKNSFAITYDYIKEKAKSGSEKLKEWLKNR